MICTTIYIRLVFNETAYTVHSECLILESNADFKQQYSVNSSCSTFISPGSFVFNINVFVSYMFLKYLKLSPECCLLV